LKSLAKLKLIVEQKTPKTKNHRVFIIALGLLSRACLLGRIVE
jgi:hypothetical protein